MVNWDDRTYNITLNASSTATSTVTEPVDVVLVLDKSPSMNFRSGLVYSTEGTSAKLDQSKVYYYVTNIWLQLYTEFGSKTIVGGRWMIHHGTIQVE